MKHDCEIQFRPIFEWPGVMTPADKRQRPRYDCGPARNKNDLRRELTKLKARDAFVQGAYRHDQIRLDGMPKSGARPQHPGLIVTYENDAGEMFDFACDAYRDAEQNLREIVLTLQRLRLVEESPMHTAGRQYQGFKRIGAESGMPTDVHDAAAILSSMSDPTITPLDILTHKQTLDRAYRFASTKSHPDACGSAAMFQRVTRAREILNKHHKERLAGDHRT